MPFAVFDENLATVNFLSLDNGNGMSGDVVVQYLPQPQRIDTLIVTNTDSIDHNLAILLSGPAGSVLLATLLIPAGAGTPGVPVVDGLALLLPATTAGLVMPALYFLFASTTEVITAGKSVTLAAFGGVV